MVQQVLLLHLLGIIDSMELILGLKTGSQSAFSYQTPGDTTSGFYMPSLSSLGVVDITTNILFASLGQDLNRTSFSAASRSLSSAPYISASSYTFDFRNISIKLF